MKSYERICDILWLIMTQPWLHVIFSNLGPSVHRWSSWDDGKGEFPRQMPSFATGKWSGCLGCLGNKWHSNTAWTGFNNTVAGFETNSSTKSGRSGLDLGDIQCRGGQFLTCFWEECFGMLQGWKFSPGMVGQYRHGREPLPIGMYG